MQLKMSEGRSRDLIESQATEPAEKSEVHKKIQEYIGKRYEVQLTDGRFIRGTMIATDKDANMVFNKADERWTVKADRPVRFLGQAMISKKYVKKMCLLPDPKETEI
ncbi:unnamed protein product [Caenorhabditis nigoni]